MIDNSDVGTALVSAATTTDSSRLARACSRAAAILAALEKRGHDRDDIAEYVARYAEELESPTARGISRVSSSLLSHLEKQHGIVPPGHYRNQWMAIGMSVFGLPIGVAFSLSQENFAFVGIGLPLGMAIGMAVGAGKDNQAKAAGLQLEIEET
jgi:hypothetical protein